MFLTILYFKLLCATQNNHDYYSWLRSLPSYSSYRRYPKPPYPYAGLITAAIWSSPGGALSVADIYASLRRMFPFFSAAYTGWQSSVRHTLTNTPCFVNRAIGSCRRWTVDAAKVPPEAFRRQRTPEARRGYYGEHLLTHLADVASRDTAAPPVGDARRLSFGVESFLPSRVISSPVADVRVPPSFGVESFLPSRVISSPVADVRVPSSAGSRAFNMKSFLPSTADVTPTLPMCPIAAPPGISTYLPTRGFDCQSRLPVSGLTDAPCGHTSVRPSYTTPRPQMSRANSVPRPFDIDSLLAPPSRTPRLRPTYLQPSWSPVAPPSADTKCLLSSICPYNASSIPQCIERCSSLSFLADIMLASEGYV